MEIKTAMSRMKNALDSINGILDILKKKLVNLKTVLGILKMKTEKI